MTIEIDLTKQDRAAGRNWLGPAADKKRTSADQFPPEIPAAASPELIDPENV